MPLLQWYFSYNEKDIEKLYKEIMMKFNSGNTTLNYETYGEGKLFFIFNGFKNDLTAMTKVYEPILEGTSYKRIYVDHPGVGDTLIGEDVNTIEDMLKVMLSFVDGLAQDEHFLLAGYSYGGYISRYILNQRVKQVDGLMLLTPVIIKEMHLLDVDHEILSIKHKDNKKQASINHNIDTKLMASMAKTNHDYMQSISETSSEVKIDLDTFEGDFDRPTLIITGRQDNVLGYKDAYKILDKYPRATYAALDMCGHAAQVEQEDLFKALFNEWLYRLGNEVKK